MRSRNCHIGRWQQQETLANTSSRNSLMPNNIQSLQQLAAQNDAEAQFELAEAYRTGDGIAENPAEALRWYRAAAELGHADAQNNLGAMYLAGTGTARDAVA